MAAKVVVYGAVEMKARLLALRRNAPQEFMDAITAEIDDVELPEVDERTPMRTGRLKSTNRREGPYKTSTRWGARIKSGGAEAPYAPAVHNDPEAFHPHGQAFYISSVLLESAPYMARRIARRISLARMTR